MYENKKNKLSQVLYCLEHESNLSCWRRPSKQCLRHEGRAYLVQAMGEQKLIQDLGVQKLKREKADRDAVNTGRVIQKRNKAIKEGGGVTTKAEHTDPVDEKLLQERIPTERWPECKGDGCYTVELSYNPIINQRNKNTSCEQALLKNEIRNYYMFANKTYTTHTCSKLQKKINLMPGGSGAHL